MKLKLFLVTCGVFLICFCSCDELILGVKGKDADLQGKWQKDSENTVYYNFQNNLFQYQDIQKGVGSGYYVLSDTELELQLLKSNTPTSITNPLSWDVVQDTNENDSIFYKVFAIKKLTSKKMSLSSGESDISFHKF